MWKLGSSGRLPDLWNMKLTFSSCEVGSYCWQSLVAGAGSHLCAVCGTREDLLRCKERGTTLPQGHWMWLQIPHLEIKLSDLPSDSFFIPGTRLKACCVSPSPGEQYPGQGHLTAVCSYTATRLFPHSVPLVDVKRLHRKLTLAFPQLQVTSSLLR